MSVEKICHFRVIIFYGKVFECHYCDKDINEKCKRAYKRRK